MDITERLALLDIADFSIQEMKTAEKVFKLLGKDHSAIARMRIAKQNMDKKMKEIKK